MTSLKRSEHTEFNMCENVRIRGTALSFRAWNVGITAGIRPSLLICLLTHHHLFHWSEMSSK